MRTGSVVRARAVHACTGWSGAAGLVLATALGAIGACTPHRTGSAVLPTPGVAAATAAGSAPTPEVPSAVTPPSATEASAASPSPAASTLRAADLAMSRALAVGDVEGFGGIVHEGAIWGGPASLLRGRAEVIAAWTRYAAPDGPRLTWAPTASGVSRAGDLGYTVGDWRLATIRNGQPVSAAGRYVTVWQRGGDGAWHALFDHALEVDGRGAAHRSHAGGVASASGDLHAEIGTWSRPDGARGSYLTVARRVPGATDETVVEAIVEFPR